MRREVIDLQRRRQQREMDAIYRCIRRAVDVPERLIDDVRGPEPGRIHRVMRRLLLERR